MNYSFSGPSELCVIEVSVIWRSLSGEVRLYIFICLWFNLMYVAPIFWPCGVYWYTGTWIWLKFERNEQFTRVISDSLNWGKKLNRSIIGHTFWQKRKSVTSDQSSKNEDHFIERPSSTVQISSYNQQIIQGCNWTSLN